MKRNHFAAQLLSLAVVAVGCSKTFYPVSHQTSPERLPNGAPTGAYFERHCLRAGKVYALELPGAVAFGRVINIKKHARLPSMQKKALAADDTVTFQVEHQVSDSTNYLHATRNALMQGHGYHLQDSLYVATIRHADIRAFNCFGSGKNVHATSAPWRHEPSPHTAVKDWRGMHLCPITFNQHHLLHLVANHDSAHYRIIFGTINSRSDGRLCVTIENEIIPQTNRHALAVADIMTFGIGFQKEFLPRLDTIDHDEVIAFRPLEKVSTRAKPPNARAGQTAAATVFLLAAMVGAIVLLF